MTKKLAPFSAPRMAAKPSAAAHRPKGRPPVDEAAARDFVQGEQHESRRRRTTPGERVGVYLPTEIAQQLRLAAVAERRSISDAITDAVREWLQRRA